MKNTFVKIEETDFTKEKQMTAFRKWFVALTVLVLVGAAYGQVINCQSAASQPRVRAEGLTELVSDVVMICSTTATLTAPVVEIGRAHV